MWISSFRSAGKKKGEEGEKEKCSLRVKIRPPV